MHSINRRNFIKNLAAGAALGATFESSRALASPGMPIHAKPPKKRANPDLVFHGQGFEPMTAHITSGEKLEITSAANSNLRLTSAPTAPEKIRRTIGPGVTVSLQFQKPGLYLLYDSETTRFDDKVGQVAARRSAKQFPLPAYSVILVTNAQNNGLDTTSPQVKIPDSYMTFEPWAVVVNAGEPITFINNDNDAHIAMPSPEPMIMPTSLANNGRLSAALWFEHMESFAPITLAGDGGKGVLTLSQPGLHHYYCPVHAAYDSAAFTFAPLKSYGGYPFIMDGVIVVLPT